MTLNIEHQYNDKMLYINTVFFTRKPSKSHSVTICRSGDILCWPHSAQLVCF